MKKIAVVTGSSYGLGESISKKLLAKGFKVYGISRSKPKMNSEWFVWIKADLCNPTAFAYIASTIQEKTIGLLINNAGDVFAKLSLEFTDELFEKTFDLDFKAPIKLTQALVTKLINGFIINISSLSDRYPDPMFGLYGSSKAALNIYFETIAAENKNLKIINVLPNYIDTPMQHTLNDNNKDFDWNMPMKPDQVAELIPYIIDNPTRIDSGSRVIVVSTVMGDMSKNPEKLWVYNVDNKQLKSIK
jgi:short-subunit dehydrogenase